MSGDTTDERHQVRYCAQIMQRKGQRRVLAVDVGGNHVKIRVSGRRETRQFESGPTMTPRQMVARVRELSDDWKYDVVSIGYPGVVLHGKIVTEPYNLGRGWVGFDFRKAFGRPTQLMNDAAMQAIGSYEGGRMLFLGLGTGLGSALVVDGVVAPMELAHLPYKHGRSYEDYVGDRGRRRLGAKKWRRTVAAVVEQLSKALEADYVVLGGGNARKLKKLPKNARLGNNEFAFLGGISSLAHAGTPPRRLAAWPEPQSSGYLARRSSKPNIGKCTTTLPARGSSRAIEKRVLVEAIQAPLYRVGPRVGCCRDHALADARGRVNRDIPTIFRGSLRARWQSAAPLSSFSCVPWPNAAIRARQTLQRRKVFQNFCHRTAAHDEPKTMINRKVRDAGVPLRRRRPVCRASLPAAPSRAQTPRSHPRDACAADWRGTLPGRRRTP